MRRKLLLVALVIMGSLTVFAPSAHAAVSIGVSFFYNDLAPHGHWFQMDNYGWVWAPRHVSATWRPYTMGHWAYGDDYGWTWVSNEDFGWATYHYGRWFFDADYGWVWVPGDQWAPAWVSWRHGGGYAGWAPLPPEYEWERGGYYGGGYQGGLAPTQYVFVREPYLADPVVYRHIVPWNQDDQIVRVTRDVTRYETVGDRIVNRAVPVREVEQAAGHALPRYRVEAAPTAPRRAVVQGNTVRVFRATPQQIAQAPRAALPAPTEVQRVKPHPAAAPARPTAARVAPPPAPAPNRAAPRGAEVQSPQAERQQQQEQARQQQATRQKEAQQQKQQQQAERQRQQEQARQQQAGRQKQQEQARQEQLTRQKEAQQQRQQAQAERQRQEQIRQQQQEQHAQALREQQAARQRAQQQREQQKREQQAKKKPKQPDQPPPDKGGR